MLNEKEPLVAECFGLPTYVVDAVIRRDLGSGIASIINCRTVNGLLIPQCEVIVSAQNLLPLTRASADFAAEMYRRHQMAVFMEGGARH